MVTDALTQQERVLEPGGLEHLPALRGQVLEHELLAGLLTDVDEHAEPRRVDERQPRAVDEHRVARRHLGVIDEQRLDLVRVGEVEIAGQVNASSGTSSGYPMRTVQETTGTPARLQPSTPSHRRQR